MLILCCAVEIVMMIAQIVGSVHTVQIQAVRSTQMTRLITTADTTYGMVFERKRWGPTTVCMS